MRAARWLDGALSSPRFVPGVFLLALAVRLGWVAWIDPFPVYDAGQYLRAAGDIASGKGYVNRQGQPWAYWPVGYPAFLALIFRVFGHATDMVRVIQALLDSLTVLLAWACARRIFSSETVGRIAMLILAFLPSQVVAVNVHYSEVLFLFLTMLGAWGVLCGPDPGPRPLRAAAAGLAFGAACLVRPQVLPLPLLLLALRVVRGEGWSLRLRRLVAGSAVVYLAAAAVLTPWTLRNYRHFGTFFLVSTNGGVNLWIGNKPGANGGYHVREKKEPSARSSSEYAPPLPVPEHLRDRRYAAMALRAIRKDPGHFLRLVPMKLARLWTSDTQLLRFNKDHTPNGSSLVAAMLGPAQSAYLAVLLGAAAGVFLLIRRGRAVLRARPRALAGLCVIALFTAVTIVFFGMPRYHHPMMPWLAMYGAYAAARLGARLARRERCGLPDPTAGAARALLGAVRSPRFVPALCVAALLLRLAWAGVADQPLSRTAGRDIVVAQGIAAGRGYLGSGGAPSVAEPVGYPAFLALVYRISDGNRFAPKLAQALLAVGTVLLTLLCARKVIGSETAARLAMVPVAFLPGQIGFVNLIAPQTLLAFLMLLGAWLILPGASGPPGPLRLLGGGAALGAAALVNPYTVALPVALLLATGGGRGTAWGGVGRLARSALVILLGLFCVLLSWTVRNYRVSGSFVLVTTQWGRDLMTGNNPEATGGIGNIGRVNRELARRTTRFWGDPVRMALEVNRQGLRMGGSYIATQPARVLALLRWKLFHLWRHDANFLRGNLRDDTRPLAKPTALGILSEALYLTFLLSVTAGLALTVRSARRGKGPPLPWAALAAPVLLTFMGLVFYTSPRDHQPLVPWLAIYAGLALSWLLGGRSATWDEDR